jgi:hypothetical protein
LIALDSFLKITEEAQAFGRLISTEKSNELILTENGLGCILGNIFTN